MSSRGIPLWPWGLLAVLTIPLAVLALRISIYGGDPLFADVDWYRTALPAITSDAALYDPAKLVPHVLGRPVYWDQAPSTALFTAILLLPGGDAIWGVGLAMATLVGVMVIWPRVGLGGALLLAPVLIAWHPIQGAMIRGNTNALVFLCLAVALRWPRAAGWAIGVATAAKLVPVLAVAWLLGKRDFRGALIAVVIPLVATLVVLIWKGPTTVVDFVVLRLNQTVQVTGFRWSPAQLLGVSAIVGYAIAFVLAIAAWRWASFTLAVVAMLMSVPVMHVHYWTWILVPTIGVWAPWLIDRQRSSRSADSACSRLARNGNSPRAPT